MAAPLPYSFPARFVWGAATAAQQIEGAAAADGRGESIWDHFSRVPGKIAHGDTPAIACDHYHRYREDFALLRQLGVRHYRLSIAWPRLFPTGRGPVNERGLSFYHRLFDTLAKHDIKPWVTLFHWDLPQALEEEGGWRVRGTVDAFATFAETVVRVFGDRVKDWITLNEIPCFIGMGYGQGNHAPGATENPRVLAQAYHHALLAHGQAVRIVRAFGGRGARVGLTHNPDFAIPFTETARDIAAASAWTEQKNWHLLAPVFHGAYPAGYLRSLGRNRPHVQPGDLELISAPTDFLGLNVYTAPFVRAGARGKPEVLPLPRDYPMGGLPWLHLAPQSLYWALRHMHELYSAPAYFITENGVGYEEAAESDGQVNDLHRCEYLRSCLINVHRAATEKIPVQGYFVWSLLDNFEWSYGYAKRFGIVFVDYATQRRTPKLSAQWYSTVVRENRVV